MKHLLLLLLFFAAAITASAQFAQNNAIYLSGELGGGNYFNGDFLDRLVVDNYTWDYGERHRISFIINPKIEFPFTRYWGLTVSPIVQFSKDRTYFGIGIGSMIGLLRP